MQPEAEENQNNNTVPEELNETEDMESLKQALAEAKAKAESHLANWQRTQADFINYKRRNEQERVEFSKFANASLVLSLLPFMDDLERALAAIPHKSARLPWVEGIRLIEHKFKTTLKAQGLTTIKSLGELFDPNLHEAVRQDKGKDGIVIEELQKGYKFHDRVIRHTMVVVGNGEEAEKEDK